MKGKGIICLSVFGLILIIASALASSEASINTTTASHEKFFDPKSMNLSVKPGDDFYEYVDGSWIKSHPVPSDKYSYGEFEMVRDRNYDLVKGIVESAANNTSAAEDSIDQKIGEFYRMGMDNATLEKQRLDPIKAKLELDIVPVGPADLSINIPHDFYLTF